MSEEIEEQGEESPRDYEAEAKALGWRPKEEFNGPEEKWTDAEEYIRKGEEVLPIVRANNKKLIEKVQVLEQTLSEFEGWRTQTEKKAYERAMKDIEAKQRQAVVDQDVEAFEAAAKEKESLVSETTKEQSNRPDPVAEAWAKENNWFNSDAALKAYAIEYHGELLKEKPGLTLSENLEEVTQEVRRRFPEKFGNPKRGNPSRVEGGGQPSGRTGKKGYADLPPEAKQACDRFVKQGLMTREEYVKDFDWSE